MRFFKYFTILCFIGVFPYTFANDGDMVIDGDSQYNAIYISGGHPMGLRFATAGAVCMFANSVPCVVLPATNSLASLDALAAGTVDMAVVQSDWLHHAVDGSSRFKQLGANPNLRALAVLGVETVLVAVRKASGITHISDLKQHTFVIGADKTYRGLFGKALLKSVGISQKSVNLIQTTTDASVQALCSGTADASVFVVSTPNNTMDTLTAQCDVVFLSLDDTVTNKIQKSFKGVSLSMLAPDTYWNQPRAIRSLGLYTVLVTTTGVNSAKAQTVQSAIYDNLDSFRTMHPAFNGFSKDFIRANVGVPYYKPTQ